MWSRDLIVALRSVAGTMLRLDDRVKQTIKGLGIQRRLRRGCRAGRHTHQRADRFTESETVTLRQSHTTAGARARQYCERIVNVNNAQRSAVSLSSLATRSIPVIIGYRPSVCRFSVDRDRYLKCLQRVSLCPNSTYSICCGFVVVSQPIRELMLMTYL